ncbi:MAG TPA: right-handed parallel beta-helix repeat-containing protein [Streptosporangiaceae bacterium]|jgi:hypothetical protein
MSQPRHRDGNAGSRRQAVLVAVIALCVFAILATMPLILTALNVHIRPVAATKVHGVKLLRAPKAPLPVTLPAVARPIDSRQSPATPPIGNPAREAALVSSEDARIRVLLHAAVRIFQPEVIPVRGSLPTLVLPAGPHAYTATDLVQYGALVRLKHHAALLIDNVFVSTNATLNLTSPSLHVLYMDSSTDGFASIVAWNGNLEFAGTASQPMTITGWDRIAKTPASDRGFGRSYIREVGGKLTLSDVRVSSLGFWSGRTGGVAWTGLTGQPSTGGATRSTFTNSTYGAFVDRGQNIAFNSDLFEFNQLDGLHIHRYSTGTTVSFSSASRNGDNGFLIGRATQSTLLSDDLSENNEANGFLIDGRPLVSGASASGSAIAPGSGAKITHSDALYNEKTGILVEGGTRTVLTSDAVCGRVTGIAARFDATNIVITGNDVRCHPRSGLSIGPGAPGAVVSGNAVSGARIAVLVRSSGRIEVDNNRLTGATVFGITARGAGSVVSGVGNTISGTGFRAVDARADARTPQLTDTNTSGWQHHARSTVLAYLLFHPLALLWLSIVVLVLLCYLWSRRKKLPPHPYPVSTRWRPDGEGPSGHVPISVNGATAGAATHSAPSPVGTVPVGPGQVD